MSWTKNLERLKTLPRKKGSTSFNAPGIYYPEYGRTTHFISGRGIPGSPPSGGNWDGGYNPTIPGTPSYRNWTALEQGYETGVPSYYFSNTYYGQSAGPAPAPYSTRPSSNITWYTNFTFTSSNVAVPTQPGEQNYNPVTPGAPGANSVVLGVPFPGGAAGTPAPVVTPTFVPIAYSGTGVNITVPSGGYVTIENR